MAEPKWPLLLAQRIERGLNALIAVLLAVITVSLIYQVFGRYVLGRAPGWSEEVARILSVWLTMLGSAACLRRGGHIAISVLVSALPARIQTIALWLRDLAVLATAGVLAWAGFRYAQLNAAQDSAALEIPMSYVYASLWIGAGLIALQLLLSRLGREEPVAEPLEW